MSTDTDVSVFAVVEKLKGWCEETGMGADGCAAILGSEMFAEVVQLAVYDDEFAAALRERFREELNYRGLAADGAAESLQVYWPHFFCIFLKLNG